jgi:hypothetical protein
MSPLALKLSFHHIAIEKIPLNTIQDNLIYGANMVIASKMFPNATRVTDRFHVQN